eukprot:scaffold34975_cov66-Phaeocystis_antarctica.AAC.5
METAGGKDTAVAETGAGKLYLELKPIVNKPASATVKLARIFSRMAVEDGLAELAISWAMPGTVACRFFTVITTSLGSGLTSCGRRRGQTGQYFRWRDREIDRNGCAGRQRLVANGDSGWGGDGRSRDKAGIFHRQCAGQDGVGIRDREVGKLLLENGRGRWAGGACEQLDGARQRSVQAYGSDEHVAGWAE